MWKALCPTIGKAARPKFREAPVPNIWASARPQRLGGCGAQNLGEACPTSGNHVSRIWARCKIKENANPISKIQLCPKVGDALPKLWNDNSGRSPQILGASLPQILRTGGFPNFGDAASPTFGRDGQRQRWEVPLHKFLETSPCPHLRNSMP